MVQKNRRQKMESIYGADFWSECHGYKLTVASLPVSPLLAGDSWLYLLQKPKAANYQNITSTF